MKHASLVAAAAIILLANAVVLIHAARNRSRPAEAEISLTDRELSYYRDTDDSGVGLSLHWVDFSLPIYGWRPNPGDSESEPWLDKTKLEALGFDCSQAPSEPNAGSFYGRQIPRTGFVVLEYDGAAWRSRAQRAERIVEGDPERKNALDNQMRTASRLVAIDAARDATALRTSHPDRNRFLIVPAVIAVSFIRGMPGNGGRPEQPPRLTGYVQEIPDLVHVPRPFSDGFRALSQTTREEKRNEPLYRVHLRYGSLLEPWVTGVEFLYQ